MDLSKVVSVLSLVSSGENGGILGSLARLMGAQPKLDETLPDLSAIDANTWAEQQNALLQEIGFGDAAKGKGSYFGQGTQTTVRTGAPTALSSGTADSLAERIAFDFMNMLKLSESGRTTIENGQIRTACVPNFYYDTTGNLTVGYGTNVDAHPEMLNMLDIVNVQTGRSLTLEEKKEYLRRLREQYAAMGSPRNMADAKYGTQAVFNECRVTEASATAVMQQEIQNQFSELMADFRAHGVDPATIDHNMLKLALDIKYNVGGKLSKKYPTLFGKICRREYETIEPKDYRACTSKTDRNACNKSREAMKAALVAQAQLVQRVMRENPPPSGANAETLAAYKEQVFRLMVAPTFATYNKVPRGQILLPDALRSTALSIETALYGSLTVNQMAGAVQTADNVLASSGARVDNAGLSSQTGAVNVRNV